MKVEKQTHNLQKALNYTLFFRLVNFSWPKIWDYFVSYNKMIMSDEPIIRYVKELENIFKIEESKILETYQSIEKAFDAIPFIYNIISIEDAQYSKYLRASLKPPIFLFTRGNTDYLKYPAVSVVGTREPTEDGSKRSEKVASLLADMGFIVASGLAKGIDAAAHKAAIRVGGRTMAVIGTPLDESYPRENKTLQEQIAESYLLISQYPFTHPITPFNFPTRNQTMSGLSLATIIIEAGETSGALIQAQQCLRQKRKLFILKNLLDNPKLEWPKKYVGREGVFVVSKIDDLIRELQKFQLVEEPGKIKQENERNTLF